MAIVLNDVHSQMNETEVDSVLRPASLDELVECVRSAGRTGRRISVSGGRHAMGAQQFATASLHIDCRSLDQVISMDPDKGLLRIGAGGDWLGSRDFTLMDLCDAPGRKDDPCAELRGEWSALAERSRALDQSTLRPISGPAAEVVP